MKAYFLHVQFVFLFVVLFNPLSSQISYATDRQNVPINVDVNLGQLGASQEDFHYKNYFTINSDLRVSLVDLLNFENKAHDFPYPAVPYNRRNHFGTWINIPKDQFCQNTRTKVLIRDSQSDVTFTPNGCNVKSGNWADPYSGASFENSSAIQIDHLVPLKNAYMTGAHEWSQGKRCLYANYLQNNFHLISVSGGENLKKSDNTPAVYVPPNKKHVCQYIKHWLQVKVIWNLRLTPKESEAVLRTVENEQCDRATFKMPTSELVQQRNYIEGHEDFCWHPEAINELAAGF